MRELDRILNTWASQEAQALPAVLATVVDTNGSAYRRPGARMLLTRQGERVGSVSGGCLESDLLKKAWWWTESGKPVLRTYDTHSDEDAAWAFGLGCNGVVRVLLERLTPGVPNLCVSFLRGLALLQEWGVIATVITAPAAAAAHPGDRIFVTFGEFDRTAWPASLRQGELESAIEAEAMSALNSQASSLLRYADGTGTTEVFLEVVAPARELYIFGGGHDVPPLIDIACNLGWRVTVANQRSVAVQRSRFPQAHEIIEINSALSLPKHAAAVVMNHDYAADRDRLRDLLAAGIVYIGMLGPKARTEQMLRELDAEPPFTNLHAPAGLDIGADDPESIALAIVSEIQAVHAGRAGGMLRRRQGSIHSPDHVTELRPGPMAVSA